MKSREYINKREREYYTSNIEQKQKRIERVKQWKKSNMDKVRQSSKSTKIKMREKIFSMYGSECCLCGFSDKRALSLDHVMGNGNVERKELGQWGVFRKATSCHSPNEYRILCMNCQFIENHRNMYGGGE